jgi:hypothetical protein
VERDGTEGTLIHPDQMRDLRPQPVTTTTTTPPSAPPVAFVVEKSGNVGLVVPHSSPSRDPNQPSADRQQDILAAIRAAGTPLTRSEIVNAMKLRTEGKLGHHLAWMMTNRVLINIPNRGYWPADQPAPE